MCHFKAALFTISILISPLLFGQQPTENTQNNSNSSAAPGATATTPATPTTSTSTTATSNIPSSKGLLCCDIKISGYLEGSYNHLARDNEFYSGILNRNLDIKENGFTLHQANLTIARQPTQGFGGLVDLILGRDALLIAPFGYNPHIGSSNEIGFVPLEVYGQYATGPFTVIAGNFNSIIGIEADNPTQNSNFSLSELATFTQPNTHLGTRLSYTVSDKLLLIAGVNNGWDSIRDTPRRKTIELGIGVTPNADLLIKMQALSGQERVNALTNRGPLGTRNLFDIYGTYHLNKKWALSANYDYGSQANAPQKNGSIGTATWQGLAAYLNYQYNDKWLISFRAEEFDDKDGYRTGIAQNLKELTLTIDYIIVTNLTLFAETRRDFSNVASFVDKHSALLGKTQQSYALMLVYKFGESKP